jgi:uncharacterized protein (TIGR04551 family)
MSRALAALAALLLAGVVRAEEPKKPDEKKGAQPAAGQPATGQPAAGQPAPAELDPATRAAIQREVEKAREQIRDEVRAEIQGAQSAAEFLGAVAPGPKLQFLQLDGYFRVRGQLFNNLDLGFRGAAGNGLDPAGYPFSPQQLTAPYSGTQITNNMRFRLEPTLNVSELVRVRSQIDILDNYVLGSSVSHLFNDPFSPYPVPFYGSSRVLYPNDPTADRAPILPKRVWAEVQTPVGLLSFGRMPSEWGLGVLTHAGAGIDDDFGDTVDRIQFALPPVQTPIGALTFVPILDFDADGVLSADPHFGAGVGQPFNVDSTDDARTYAVKIARLDTDDEIRRKNERGEASINFGGYYNYRSQKNTVPLWYSTGFNASAADLAASVTRRSSDGHIFSIWARYLTSRWRVEAEGVGVLGHIGVAATVQPATPGVPGKIVPTTQPVDLSQWGGTVVTEYKAIPSKLMVGGEFGIASGDSAPGFGNVPDRIVRDPTTGAPVSLQPPGSLEGPQYGNGDNTISNFRFNPAYRVDLVLWRLILGQVTDAWYLKPKLRWDIFPGLAFDASIIYSQAIYAESTPGNSRPLGVELDTGLTYTSGSGFIFYGQWGILQPLDGFGKDLKRGQNLSLGLAVKF